MRSLTLFFHSALVAIPVLILGCDNDESIVEPESVQLLKLTVDASYVTKNIDNWVMVHDKNGTLIGAKKFEGGQVVTLETRDIVPEDLISVTLLSFDSASTLKPNSVYLDSYSHLTKGQEWTLKRSTGGSGSGTTRSNFTIDIDGIYDFPYSFAVSNSEGGSVGSWTLSSGVLSGEGTFSDKNKSTFMVSLESELGHPQYAFIENVTNNGYYEVSVDDLVDFDHILNVPFQETEDVFCRLQTYDSETKSIGYTLNLTRSFNGMRDGLQLGYLDQFKKYHLFIELDYGTILYSYTSNGNLPKAVKFPFEADYSFQNTGVNEFSMVSDPSYSYRSSSYYQMETGNPDVFAHWDITSPATGFKVLTLPDEVMDTYPFLNIKSFDHSFTNFYSLVGVTYDDYVGGLYKGTAAPDEYERYLVQVAD